MDSSNPLSEKHHLFQGICSSCKIEKNYIDFNKNNCDPKNLNTLCLRCNVKINRERDYWTGYFKIKN